MVLVGAEAVVENGGVINKLGTNQLAIVAKTHNVPVYVAAESYKFARLFPLNQVCWCTRSAAGGQLTVCPSPAGCWDLAPVGIRGLLEAEGRCVPAWPELKLLVLLPLLPAPPLPLLAQRDMPLERKQLDFGPLLPASVAIDNPSRDYTPPQFISLLFTDLGVLTPAAVSDELIQLYV